MSTIFDPCSTQATVHYATRVWSRWKSWVTNVLTMPLHLAHSDSPLVITLPHAGFKITLTLPCVLMAVTTSVRSWNDCSTFEQMQRRFSKIGVSVVFTIGFIVFLVHLTCISGRFVYSCSQPFLFEFLFPRTVMDSLSSSASTVPGF